MPLCGVIVRVGGIEGVEGGQFEGEYPGSPGSPRLR